MPPRMPPVSTSTSLLSNNGSRSARAASSSPRLERASAPSRRGHAGAMRERDEGLRACRVAHYVVHAAQRLVSGVREGALDLSVHAALDGGGGGGDAVDQIV